MKTLVHPPVDNQIVRNTLGGTLIAGQFIDLPTGGVGVYPEGGVSGDDVAFYLGGTYRITKLGADGAWANNIVLYLDAGVPGSQAFTLTAGAHQAAGRAAAPAAAGDSEGLVTLIPTATLTGAEPN